jgi:hypothetical protein
MNLYEFLDQNPWQAFWLGFFLLIVLSAVGDWLFRCWNRLLRHLSIQKHGWPPAHCDADGATTEKETTNVKT